MVLRYFIVPILFLELIQAHTVSARDPVPPHKAFTCWCKTYQSRCFHGPYYESRQFGTCRCPKKGLRDHSKPDAWVSGLWQCQDNPNNSSILSPAVEVCLR